MKGVMICEGEFEQVVELATPELFQAYCDGFSAGAGKYGGDDAGIYTRDDLEEWLRWKDDTFYAKRIAIVDEHLPAN